MTFAILKDAVLFVLAIYGAALSTLNWYTNQKRDRRSLKVELNTVMVAYQNRKLGSRYVQISAVNDGLQVVTVSSIYLLLPGGKKLMMTAPGDFAQPDTDLPAKLASTETAKAHMSYTDVAIALFGSGKTGKITVYPACEDSLGKTYRGKQISIDIDDFLGQKGRAHSTS